MIDLLRDGIFMQWINTIKETVSGIEWVFLTGFIVLLLYYLIKGNAKERIFLVVSSLMYIVLVLNPISCMILERVIGYHFSIRVYRFFWAFPIYFAYAYFMTKLLMRTQKKYVLKGILLIVSAGLVIVGVQQIIIGSKHTLLSNGILTPVDNAYKIDTDVIQAADIIEADKNGKSVFVNVATYGVIDWELRAYDGSLIKVADLDYLYTGDMSAMPVEEVMSSLDAQEVDYIIMSSDNANNSILQQCGYEIIGVTTDEENPYYVYRVKSV